MSVIKLNVYKENNKKEIEKTYEVEGYDLMLGTVEDFIKIVDIDKMTNNTEIVKVVVGSLKQIKPLLLDVFEGITEDELNRVKINEIIPCIVQICKATAETMTNFLKDAGK